MPSVKELFPTLDAALTAGDLDPARAHRPTLEADAKDALALTLLGRLAAAEGDVVGGIAFMGEAIRLEPYYEPAYRYRAEMFHAIGRVDRVVEDIESLLLYHPVKEDLLANYVELSLRVGRLDHARGALERAVRRTRENAFFLNLSGLIAQADRRKDDAVAFYVRAVERDPESPHYLNNLGTALHNLDRFRDAQVALERAIAVDPRFDMAWYNLGNVYKDRRRFVEAEHCYRRAIALRPEYPDARLNLGCILIQQNRWDEGWKQYEYRWHVPDLLAQPPAELPRWRGESLSGKHVLVSAEQGLGDTLQFVRYLPALTARGARVTFVCPPALTSLLSRFDPEIAVTSDPQSCGGYWAPLMSLPPLTQAQPDAIPAAPYLEVEADRVAYYRAELGRRASAKQLRVGLVWGGNPDQQDDTHRSASLAALAPLFALPNVRWIGLQKGGHAAELAASGAPVEDWGARLDDFDETGALMSALDGVVSVCSSPLHLAGALGVRTIGLLGWASDWRWGLNGDATAWYPSVTTVRQAEFGDWSGAATEAAALVRAWTPLPAPAAAKTDRRATRPPAPTLRAKTHYGVMDLLKHEPVVTASLRAIGEYCRDELALLGSCAAPGATVVELGAGVGAHTLAFGHLVGPTGRVVAGEAQPEAFRLLERNVARAGLARVEPLRALFDAEPGARSIVELDYAVPADAPPRAERRVETPVRAIDGLGLDACALIKINGDAPALEALAGARTTLATLRPVVFVQEMPQPRPEPLLAALVAAGYRCYRYRNGLSGTRLQSPASRLAGDLGNACLAIPTEAAQPRGLPELTAERA